MTSDWVHDKVRSKFAFEGMCWEKSHIPKVVWQAGDATTNGIEGLHADVNLEGLSCTLLGGLKKGEHYDGFKMKTLRVSTRFPNSESLTNLHDQHRR